MYPAQLYDSSSLIRWGPSRFYTNLPENPYADWGNYPELAKQAGFHGETKRDIYGNFYGRFNGLTKRECVYSMA